MEKEYRIKKSAEITNILDNKQKVVSRNLTIYFKNNEANHFRFSISVSKKCGNAVERNYQKRKVREIFRQHEKMIKNVDVFIICKNTSMNLEFQELEKEILYLLRKGNLIKNER